MRCALGGDVLVLVAFVPGDLLNRHVEGIGPVAQCPPFCCAGADQPLADTSKLVEGRKIPPPHPLADFTLSFREATSLNGLCLLLNRRPRWAAQRLPLSKIYFHSEEVLKLLLQGNEIQEAHLPAGLGVLKVDQDVKVAFRAGLSSESRTVEIEPIHGIILPRTRECLLEPSFDRLELWIGARGRASRIGLSLRHGEWAILR